MKEVNYPELVAEMAKHSETQNTLSKLLDLSQQTISNKLLGKTEWTISEIEKLCEHYNKNYHELFKKGNE